MLKVSYESGWGHEAFLHGPHQDNGRHSQYHPPQRKVKQPGPRLMMGTSLQQLGKIPQTATLRSCGFCVRFLDIVKIGYSCHAMFLQRFPNHFAVISEEPLVWVRL